MRIVTIGRSVENDVCLEDKSVSRKHAKIVIHSNEKCEIIDLNSSFGTFLRTPSGVKKVMQEFVDLSQKVIFGSCGPHLIQELVDSEDEVTRMASPDDISQTDPGIIIERTRCRYCAAVIQKNWSKCSECGGSN